MYGTSGVFHFVFVHMNGNESIDTIQVLCFVMFNVNAQIILCKIN